MTEISTLEQAEQSRLSRRRFVGLAGALAGAGLLIGATGCTPEPEEPGLTLGSNDNANLNAIYMVKQLQAEFYTRVGVNITGGSFGGLSAAERTYFLRIRNHKIAHREFLKNLLGSNSALTELEFDFTSIEFSKRTSLIDTAITLEDLGVGTFNGFGHKFATSGAGPELMMACAKMASVEARHAAVVRTMKQYGNFAADDTTDWRGLDLVYNFSQILGIAQPFIKTKINPNQLA